MCLQVPEKNSPIQISHIPDNATAVSATSAVTRSSTNSSPQVPGHQLSCNSVTHPQQKVEVLHNELYHQLPKRIDRRAYAQLVLLCTTHQCCSCLSKAVQKGKCTGNMERVAALAKKLLSNYLPKITTKQP
jgi:hypothetical protein